MDARLITNHQEKGRATTPWTLDVNLLEFDGNGVVDFRSPFSIEPLDALIDGLGEIIWSGELVDGNKSKTEIIRLVGIHWIPMIVHLLQHKLILMRAEKEGRHPVVTPKVFPTLMEYAKTGVLPDHTLIDYLFSGVKAPEFWRLPVRLIRSLNQTIKRRPKMMIGPTDVLITARTNNIDKWLAKTKLSPVLWEPSWYFQKIDPATAPKGEWASASQNLVQIIESRIARLDITLTDLDRKWLSRQFTLSAAATNLHLDRVLECRNKIPKRFLSAGSGVMWNRIMRLAVQMTGGTVTAFEHGCGLGFHGVAAPYLVDWFCCDQFVTRSTQSTRLLQKNAPVYEQYQLQIPDFDILETAEEENTFSPNRDKTIKRVLFVPFGASGEKARGTMLPPDISGLDFNARFITELKERGFDVAIKPHPDAKGPDVAAYMKKLDIDAETKPFEQIFEDYHMIITCDPRSSTTIAAISAQLPFIIIDLKCPPLSASVLNWLSERASVIDCHFSQDERIEVDLAAFDAALEKYNVS